MKHRWYGQAECFCCFQVDDHFEGCRLDDWEIGRFLAFEDASCITTHFAIGPGQACSVTDQTTGGNKFSEWIYSRNSVARCQRSKLVWTGREEWIGCHDKCLGALVGESRERPINFGHCAKPGAIAGAALYSPALRAAIQASRSPWSMCLVDFVNHRCEAVDEARRRAAALSTAAAARFLFFWRTQNARHWSARFCFTVPNFPIARPARYRIATLSLICCGTM